MKKKELRKLIQKKTQCTKEQAKYLARELKSLPKVLDNFVNHLDEINLYDCKSVKVVRVLGYLDDSVNIDARRVYDRFQVSGKVFELEKMYLYHLFEDRCTMEIW